MPRYLPLTFIRLLFASIAYKGDTWGHKEVKQTFAVNYYGAATRSAVLEVNCSLTIDDTTGTMAVTDTLLDLVKKSDNGRIVKYAPKR